MAARVVRLHMPDGQLVTRELTALVHLNRLTGIVEARALIDQWLLAGDVTRRPDGGLDVKHKRPAPDTQRVAEMRARRAQEDELEETVAG